MTLTKNFSRSEFACKGTDCCWHSAPINIKLVNALQVLRDTVGLPLIINSGFRCVKHNTAKEGAENSQHLYGMAADVALPQGYTSIQFAAVAESLGLFDGIGLYDNFVHLDVRGSKARWDKRKKSNGIYTRTFTGRWRFNGIDCRAIFYLARYKPLI